MLDFRSKGFRFDPRPGHGVFLRVCDILNRMKIFKRVRNSQSDYGKKFETTKSYESKSRSYCRDLFYIAVEFQENIERVCELQTVIRITDG